MCKYCKQQYLIEYTYQKFCSVSCRKAYNKEYWYHYYRDDKTYESNKADRKLYSRNLRIRDPIKILYNNRKNDAKTRDIEFTITRDDLVIPEVCPVLKTKFIRKTSSAASVGRIDPTKGYIPGNVQIISRKANVMKNNATPDELRSFASWVNQTYPL